MVQEVEPGKCEALSLNASIPKRKFHIWIKHEIFGFLRLTYLSQHDFQLIHSPKNDTTSLFFMAE
jgi:hypothetical protein